MCRLRANRVALSLELPSEVGSGGGPIALFELPEDAMTTHAETRKIAAEHFVRAAVALAETAVSRIREAFVAFRHRRDVAVLASRSEERRVGKECRCRWRVG